MKGARQKRGLFKKFFAGFPHMPRIMIKVIAETENPLFDGIAEEAFLYLSLKGEAFCEAVILAADEMRALNKRTRGIDRVTDVLSFPMLRGISEFTKDCYPLDYDNELGGVNIGSIAICAEKAKEQAAEYGHGERRETGYLFLHGLLHLLGYDHIGKEDKKRMRAVEEAVLSRAGINGTKGAGY
jgi:probable rRNA maturation factor